MQKGALVNSTTDTLRKSRLRERGQTEPGLVAFYDTRPGSGADLFLQPRSPHGAGWYQIILLGDRGTCVCVNNLPIRVALDSVAARIAPLSVARCNLSFGTRGFRTAAPTVWSGLPANVRSGVALSTFRRHLNSHPFQSSFPAA